MQFMSSYCLHKTVWHRARLKVQRGLMHKGQYQSILRYYVVNITLTLQYAADNFWGVILFIKYYHLPPFDHDIFQKIKMVNGQIQTHRQFWSLTFYPSKITIQCMQFMTSYHIHKAAWPRISLKFKKVSQRSMLNSEWFDVENIPVKLQYDAGNF